ncbi:MAG: hypothetical protein IJ325_08355 [Clostridia bacterium]|nr:hypothetical protein [Clostridia bacterium]
MDILKARTADKSWPYDSGFGNHRILAEADEGKYVRVHLPWRRRDCNPECIGIRICYTPNGKVSDNGLGTDEILNIKIEKADRAEGCIVFEAPESGIYEIYYLPYKMDGWAYSPDTVYLSPDEMTPDADWLASLEGAQVTEGNVLCYECRTPIDSFYPMEIPMTDEEKNGFFSNTVPFSLVAESRMNPIRMKYELPCIWLQRTAQERGTLTDTAHINEHYVFQLAVCAACDLQNIQIHFYTENGVRLDTDQCVCFNLFGRDIDGRFYTIKRDAATGEVLPLWCGIPLEKWGLTGGDTLKLIAEITAENTDFKSSAVITLTIDAEPLPNNGDNDLWRMARLFWLNSDIGISDDVLAPYLPIDNDTADFSMGLLGKTIRVNDLGLPAQVVSYYNDECLIGDKGRNILRDSVQIQIRKDSDPVTPEKAPVLQREIKGSAVTVLHGSAVRNDIELKSHIQYEADGHIDCKIYLTAQEDGDYDFTLQIPVASEIAASMLGMCYSAGQVPGWWEYKWTTDMVGNVLWLGCVHGGIQVKLMQEDEFWGHWGDHDSVLPAFWYNKGSGKMTVKKLPDEGTVLFEGMTGKMTMKAGQTELMHFHMILTPFHPIDTKYHWTEQIATGTPEWCKENGGTIFHRHHAAPENPYINYPFIKVEELKKDVEKYHEMGILYQIYYTVRELSNYTAEIWALRALGDEIYNPDVNSVVISDFFVEEKDKVSRKGMAFSPNRWRGGAWLVEHLVDGYVGAWHNPLSDGDCDCALGMQGFSRWHNYYLQGLKWLIDEVGIDGLYLDDIGYDRRIMKRVRRIWQDSGKRGDIDMHSGDGKMFFYGYVSPVNKYMEHLPYVDSLWLGEGYRYNTISHDYYLTEISGIPFGLMNEMLQNNGNPWRGMVFGMTDRIGRTPVTENTLRVLKDFGISEARMLGYWNPECPVTAENDQVRATAYIKDDGSVMIAIASWYPGDQKYLVSVNKEQLGIRGDYELYAPAIEGFQEETVFQSNELIPIANTKGWLFILRQK